MSGGTAWLAAVNAVELRSSLLALEKLAQAVNGRIDEILGDSERLVRTIEISPDASPTFLRQAHADLLAELAVLERDAGQLRRSREFLLGKIAQAERLAGERGTDGGDEGWRGVPSAPPSAVPTKPAGRRRPRMSAPEAVQEILMRHAGRPVRVRDIVAEIGLEGWLSDSVDPRNTITAALHRLNRDPRAPVSASGRGYFRYTG